MEKPLIHILIIWAEGKSHFDYIFKDISESFKLLNVYNFSWKQELFHENLKRFYSHSQSDKSEEDFNNIIENKIKHCGSGDFKVLIFEDENPVFENRKTSKGINKVNINVFDKKVKYRELTGGGHKIHASDNFFESNKDISLLFKTRLVDYKKEIKASNQIIEKENNVLGIPYWNSITELFFTLNNSIAYVVLRNFECLPDDYHVEGHGDIDLLVDDFNYVKYLTGAVAVFPQKVYRVYHYININNENVPFDFRYLGDDYYDKKWEFDILKNKKLSSKGFYQTDDTNYFFSLLYHACIQKKDMSADYKERLENLAKTLNLSYKASFSLEDTAKLLNEFMNDNSYAYTLPKDISVFFNKKNVELSKIKEGAHSLGEIISSTTARTETESFFTEVYQNDNVFIKVASHPVSFNENRFLNILDQSLYFPRVISFKKENNYDKVEIERIEGTPFKLINDIPQFWNKKNILHFINHLVTLLITLKENDIVHRDIRPDNLFVVKESNNMYAPRLIDFGWSIDENDENSITPLGLGDIYKKPEHGFSDVFSAALCLNDYLEKFDLGKKYIDALKTIGSSDEANNTKIDKLHQLRLCTADKNMKLTANDTWQFTSKRIKAKIGIKTILSVTTFFQKIRTRIRRLRRSLKHYFSNPKALFVKLKNIFKKA